jgi:hypothetical protein
MQEVYLQSACRHEKRAALAERWLRLEADPDKPSEYKISLLTQMSAATDARDKCLERAGLGKAAKDDWASIIDQTAKES